MWSVSGSVLVLPELLVMWTVGCWLTSALMTIYGWILTCSRPMGSAEFDGQVNHQTKARVLFINMHCTFKNLVCMYFKSCASKWTKLKILLTGVMYDGMLAAETPQPSLTHSMKRLYEGTGCYKQVYLLFISECMCYTCNTLCMYWCGRPLRWGPT